MTHCVIMTESGLFLDGRKPASSTWDIEQARLLRWDGSTPVDVQTEQPVDVACGCQVLRVDTTTLMGDLLINRMIVGHHESDLYAFDNPLTRNIIERHPNPLNNKPYGYTTFVSQTGEGALLDIPFAYSNSWCVEADQPRLMTLPQRISANLQPRS